MALNRKQKMNIPSTEEVFTNIYKSNGWKHKESLHQPFYSGPGSYGCNADKYVELISDYIKQHNIKSVTDIGCGDFAIGQKIVSMNPSIRYNGCDVVKDLIMHNNEKYSTESVNFFNIDAAKDKIPAADLLTIRQVLQHLSNAEINKILKNIKGFKYIIVTEHLLIEGSEDSYNRDKKTNDGFRLTEGSGVYLNQPPYNIPWQELLSCTDNIYVNNPENPTKYILKEAAIKSFLIKNV